MRSPRAYLTLVGLLFALMLNATPVHAQGASGCAPPQPPPGKGGYPPAACNLRSNVSTVGPGGSATFSGDGFRPNSTITLTLGSEVLGTAETNSRGSFTKSVVIPDGPAGPITVNATGVNPDNSTRVLGVSLTRTRERARADGGILPRTGDSSTGILVASGIGLLVVGAAVVFMVRRRHELPA